jgi:hypothetical protein
MPELTQNLGRGFYFCPLLKQTIFFPAAGKNKRALFAELKKVARATGVSGTFSRT